MYIYLDFLLENFLKILSKHIVVKKNGKLKMDLYIF